MKKYLNINESFIVKIWKEGNLYYNNLKTTDGLNVTVLDYGKQNNDGGPDFNSAKVKIGDRIFSGDIEIHKDFNSWIQHGHKNDRKYNTVILQVLLWDVGKNNLPVVKSKRQIPTVILSKFLNQSIHNIWQEIIQKPVERLILPCNLLNGKIPVNDISQMLNYLSIERLSMKANRIKERIKELELYYDKNVYNSIIWNKLFMEFFFEALGYSKNKEAFLKLSKNINIIALKKLLLIRAEKDLNIYVQSVLFGLSGLLFDLRIHDKYFLQLKSLFNTANLKLKSEVMINSEWQFFRLRPQNFPTVRIAYASQLIVKLLFEDLLKNIVTLFKEQLKSESYLNQLFLFLKPHADSYWNSHYKFGKLSCAKLNLLGQQRIIDIISNVIIPFVLTYSDIFHESLMKNNILKFYSELKLIGKNSIVRLMEAQILKNYSISVNTSALEQGTLQLYHFYCLREKCNKCTIGKLAFKESGFEYKLIFY